VLGLELTPTVVLTGLAGLFAVAAYGLVFAPPYGKVGYLLLGGVVGALAGQLVGERLPAVGPSLGGLHVLESLLGAWLLVWIVRRLVV
jgi:uncharacterized membrane protein YeaQ/YmgE (transglycosylase-associated protein family)